VCVCVRARVLGAFFLVCYCEIRAGRGQIVLFAFARRLSGKAWGACCEGWERRVAGRSE